MKMLETLFPVKEYPAYHEAGTWAKSDENENLNNTGYKFIIREDTGNVISCVTDKYKMVTNQQVIDAAKPVIKDIGAVLTEEKTFANGARSIWTWKIPDVKVKIDNKDYVNPTLTLKNSYDGSVQLHILAGAFRLVCSNGLTIGTTISNKVNKHSIYNVNLDKIDESIKDTVDSIKNVFKNDFPLLVNTKISPKHIHNLIKMFPDFTIGSLTQYIMGHSMNTFWDLLNAATWVATHTMKRNYESTHKLENKIYPSITKWANQVAKS
jgi:translation initiation factor IF-1